MAEAETPERGRLRIDKWLWFARFARTRTLAQKLATSGRIRINREKINSASATIRVGDVLTVALDSGVRVLKVAALADRRGSATIAQALYEDLTEPTPRSRSDPPVRVGPRPTKRERRALDNARERLFDDGPSSDTGD